MDKVSEIPKSHQKYLCLDHCIVAYLSYIKKLSEFILLKIWGFFKGFADPNWNIQIHNLFSLYLISADFHSSLFNVNHMQFIKYVYVIRIFGLMMIGAELRNKVLMEYCKFMFNYFGRGLFNIL